MQEAKLGRIKGYLTVADIPDNKRRYVQFRFYIGNEFINAKNFKAVSKQLKTYNRGLEYGYLYKYIRADRTLPAHRIEQELNEFVGLLDKIGLSQSAR
jgi:hypothetical protein